jgi:mannose-6-phosphate isomerase
MSSGMGSLEIQSVQRVDKPWGYELIFARTDAYVGKILHVKKGEALSLQYHNVKEETLFCANGRVKLYVEMDGESREVDFATGDAFHVPPRLIHRIEAIEDSDIFEVSTPQLDDVVRLDDRYGRKGTSAP